MAALREAVRAGEPVAGTWVSVGHPAVAELGASLGFDFVAVDTEHTPTSLESVENAVRAVDAAPGGTEAVVRVPWNDPVVIKRVLDIGAAGIMAPMVDSADEARALVDAVRYPPDGSRGLAAGRASNYGRNVEAYVSSANESILTMAQVETAAAVESAGDIAAVEGIDALLFGVADLSADLGVFAEWDDDEFSQALDAVLDAAHARDVPVGTLATDHDRIDDWVARGFDFLIVGTDLRYLAEGALAAKERYETRIAERES